MTLLPPRELTPVELASMLNEKLKNGINYIHVFKPHEVFIRQEGGTIFTLPDGRICTMWQEDKRAKHITDLCKSKPSKSLAMKVQAETDLVQSDGIPEYKSEFDIEYMSIRLITSINKWYPLIKRLEDELETAQCLGANRVIWRTRPEIWDDGDKRYLFARGHFLPDVRQGLSFGDEPILVG